MHQIASLQIFSVSYTGGEPTLRSDLFEILAIGASANVLQFLATNGRRIDAPYARELKSLKLRGVALSLDSAVASENDDQRGEGAFRAVVSATENLRSAGIPYSISTTVDDSSVSRLEAVINYAAFLGAQNVRIQARTVFSDGRPRLALSHSSMTEVAVIAGSHPNPEFVKFGCSIGFLKYLKPLGGPSASLYGLCDVGVNSLTIASNGHVTTCVQLLPGNENLGSVSQRTLMEILDEPTQDVATWKSKADTSRYKQGGCARCNHLASCKAGCRAFARSAGDFWNDDPNCLLRVL